MRRPRPGDPGYKPPGSRHRLPRAAWFRGGDGTAFAQRMAAAFLGGLLGGRRR